MSWDVVVSHVQHMRRNGVYWAEKTVRDEVGVLGALVDGPCATRFGQPCADKLQKHPKPDHDCKHIPR